MSIRPVIARRFGVPGKFLKAFFLLSILLFSFSLSATSALCTEPSNQSASLSEKILMPEIVVTAFRAQEDSSRTPVDVSVITEEDIRNSTAVNVPELLRTQQGVHVTDIGGNQRTYWVDLRGFGDTAPQNTLVLIDGRRVTQADLSGTDWTQLPLDRIQKIEIVRGGYSSIFYGDNASGGVINILTKEGGKKRLGTDLSGGSYGTFRANAYAEGNEKKLSYAFTGGYLTSNGYRLNSDTTARDAGANLTYNLTDTSFLRVNGGFHKDDSGLPGALKDSDFAAGLSRKDSIYPDNYANTKDGYLQGLYEIHFGANSLFKVDLSTRKRNFTSFANYSGGSFTGDTDLYVTTVSPQLLLDKRIAEGYENRLTLGMDYQHAKEEIQNDSVFFGSHTISAYTLKKSNYGWYIHDEFTILKDFSLSGGYRFDRAVFDFAPGSPEEVTYNEHSASLGFNYTPTKQVKVYFNMNRSFRYPVFDEMFSFFTNTVNPLEPQSSQVYEVGAKCAVTTSVRIGLSCFQIDTDKEIFFNPDSYNNENLDGKTKREGIETTLNWQVLANLDFFATYTYFSKARIEEGQFAGKHLPNVPEHKATAGVLLSLAKVWSFGLTGIYVGSRPFSGDFQNTLDDQESYYMLNAKVQYRWSNYKFYLNVNNLTNKKYSEYGSIVTWPIVQRGNYPSPEINFLLGVKAEF